MQVKLDLGSLGIAALCLGGALLSACASNGSNAGASRGASGSALSSVPVIAAELDSSAMRLSTTCGLSLGGNFTGAVGLFAVDEDDNELMSTVSFGQDVSEIQLQISFPSDCTDVLVVIAHDSGNGQGTQISREAFQVNPPEDRTWAAVFPETLQDVSAAGPPSEKEALLKYMRDLLPASFVITQPQVPGKPKLRPDGSAVTGPIWALTDLKIGAPCHGWDAVRVWADVFFVSAGGTLPSTELRRMTQINGAHPLLPYRHGSLRIATDNPTATGDAYLVVVIEEDPVDGGNNRYSVHYSERFDPGISAEIELKVDRQPSTVTVAPVPR